MHGTIHEFDQLPRVAHAPARAGAWAGRNTARPARAEPLVGVIRNPKSHRNRGCTPDFMERANILTTTPRTQDELQNVLASFAERQIDYLAVDGGDGTVRDVLTGGAELFGDHWPTLIVLPKGKTNALAADLGLPNVWSLPEALDAARAGQTVERRPLRVETLAGDRSRRVLGFFLGAGVITRATQAAQQAHRLGAFNSFAVVLAVLWGLLRALFGGSTDPWRAGTRMVLRHGDDALMPHSGRGHRDRRWLLAASTLENFPIGMKPFGPPRPGLKLGLIDTPSRRLVALIPVVLTGWTPRMFKAAGGHQVYPDSVDLELGDRFIFDGESFPAGRYRLRQGPRLRFVVP